MSESEEQLKAAGDVLTEEIFLTLGNGEQIDIKNFAVEFNLYEDVFSPCMTGAVLISDSANLIATLPILGNELITVKYRTPTLPDDYTHTISKTFQLYSIENRTLNNDRETYYNLCFISREGFRDKFNALVRGYKGPTHEIVSKIYQDYIECDRRIDIPDVPTGLLITDTPHQSNIRYVSNHWSPFRNFDFISKRVKGATLNGSDYLFFESNKSFYFSSIEGLIHAQSENKFEEYVIELQADTIERRSFGASYYGIQLPSAMTRVTNIKIPKTMDIIEGQDTGYHAHNIRGYDLTTKNMIESNFDFRAQNQGFVKTDTGIPIPDTLPYNPYSFSQFVPYATSLFNDYGTSDNQNLPNNHPAQYITDRMHYRRGYLNSFNNYTFEMEIPGRTDMAIGQVIDILYPSARERYDNENEPQMYFDPLLSGSYFISAIRHKITNGEHIITAEVIKNGLAASLGAPPV